MEGKLKPIALGEMEGEAELVLDFEVLEGGGLESMGESVASSEVEGKVTVECNFAGVEGRKVEEGAVIGLDFAVVEGREVEGKVAVGLNPGSTGYDELPYAQPIALGGPKSGTVLGFRSTGMGGGGFEDDRNPIVSGSNGLTDCIDERNMKRAIVDVLKIICAGWWE